MGGEEMSRSIFTPEELEELRRADAKIDAGFVMTQIEHREAERRDREVRKMYSPRQRSAETRRRDAERSLAYYRAPREEVLAKQKARYKANREELQAYYRERQRIYDAAHREERAAKKRAARAAAKSMIKQEGNGNNGAELHESVCEV
jgi:hypothetical protein